MEHTLSPREIQGRIRAGESVADLAHSSGMPVDKIEVFANPVLAERGHMAALAQAGQLRKRGDAHTHRPLTHVVTERMFARRLDPELLTWDAYRLPERTWRIIASLAHNDLTKEAWFTYDPRGRFSVCANGDARWLIGEEAPLYERGIDDENTVDLNDELALVRATTPSDEELPAPIPIDRNRRLRNRTPENIDFHPDQQTDPGDSPYDFVGPDHSDVDSIYDLLIGDDPLLIYAELTEPIVEPLPEGAGDDSEPFDPGVDQEPAVEEIPAPEEQPASFDDGQLQQSLLGEAEPTTKITRKKQKNGHMTIPSWDDILFGPTPKKK